MPKFGELLDTDVWAVPARTLTDISIEEIFDLPVFDDNYDISAVVSSGTIHTFGSWAELVPDVGAGKRLIHLTIAPAATVVSAQIEIGEGESGSEVAVGRVNFNVRKDGQSFVYPLYLALTDNARLAARVKDSGGATTYSLGVGIA